MKFLANLRDTITSVRAAVRERIDVNYTTASTDPNLSEVAVNGALSAWQNEDGSYRAQIPAHKLWDSPFRAVSRTSQTGLHYVVENEARDTTLFGVDPVDGQIVRSGVKYTTLQTTAGAVSIGASPAVYGVKIMTAIPETCTASLALTSQQIFLFRQEVLSPVTVSTARVLVTNAAVTPAASYTGFAVYSESGNTLTRIAVTDDDTALFTTGGGIYRQKSFPSSFSVAPGMYWVGIMCRAGTAPTIRSTPSGLAGAQMTGLPAGTTIATIGGSQTAFPTSFDKTSWGAGSGTQRFLIALH